MTITAKAPSWNWMATHLRQRDVTLAGISYASVRLSMEQVAGEAAGRVGHDIGSLLDLGRFNHLHLIDSLIGGLAVMLGLGDGWVGGPAGIAVTLILPVGGPIWAGLVPVETTLKGLRHGARLARRLTVGGLAIAHVQPAFAATSAGGFATLAPTPPASCNAHRRSFREAGPVAQSILIVDDSRPFLEAARHLLARDGFDVVGTASTGDDAVALAEAVHPEVALVDIHLAGESGFEVARRLAANGQTSDVTVVLMSTHSRAEFADLIDASSAAGFVEKVRLSGDAIRDAVVSGSR